MSDQSKIVNTLSPLVGKDEHKLEYIKEMIALVGEDIKIVMYYIGLKHLSTTMLNTILVRCVMIYLLLQYGKEYIDVGVLLNETMVN